MNILRKSLGIGLALMVFALGFVGSPNQAVAAATPVVSLDTLNNGGFEQVGATADSAYDWQDFNGGTAGTGYTRVQTPHSGSWSIKIKNTTNTVLSGAYQRIDLAQTVLRPVYISGFVEGMNIQKAPNSYFGATLYAEIHLKDGSVVYWNTPGNSGSFGWRWIGFNTGTLAGVNQPIDYIFVVPMLGNATGTAYFDDLTLAEYNPTTSAVTIMLDDGDVSAYTQAKPAMDKLNMVGSAAIITGEVGQQGSMTMAQIKGLAAKGWEIMSHSVTHTDLTTLTLSQVKSELRDSKNFLTSRGIKVNNFALPYGAYNDSIMAMGQNYYHSLRAFEDGTNPQGLYPYEVKVKGVISTTTVADVTNWLAQAKAENRWLVLVFHAITNTNDDVYFTTPTVFKDMIKAVSQSGVPVLTYDQALNQFAARLGTISSF